MAKKLADGLHAQVEKDALKKALARAMHIVERKAASPSTSAVLIEGKKEELSTAAYDLEIGLVSRHAAEIKRPGSIALPAKVLKAFVDLAPENVVELEALESNRVRVQSGGREAELAGLAPSSIELPPLPSSMRFAQTDTAAFAMLISGVAAAMSRDETRYNLCGAILERTRAGWRMVATDGHRLAALERAIDEDRRRAVEERVFIGNKTLDTFLAILGEDEAAPGELGFNASTVVFKREGLDIISRLQEDAFPDWAQVVPEATKHSVALPLASLEQAIKGVGFLDDRIVLHLGRNVLKLRSQSSEGIVSDRIPCEHSGADVTIAANAKYLLEALAALGESQQVNLGLEDSINPVVLRPVGDEKRSVWVVMPMRVEDADAKAITADDVEGVFAPLRETWSAQTTKREHMEHAEKIGREGARQARRDKGGPLDKDEVTWPVAGFWKTAEEFAKRPIPEDERARAREVFWLEALKPWPAGEPTRAQLQEVEKLGTKDGEKMLKAMGGNRLTLADRRGKAHPPADFWPKLSKDLGRELTDAEKDAYQEAYYDACAVEDVGEEEPKKPELKVVKPEETK